MPTYNKQQTADISKQMIIHMPNPAKASDRHGISHRADAQHQLQLCVMLILLLNKIPLLTGEK